MSQVDYASVVNFMTKDVKSVIHTQSLKQAAKLMYENDIGSVVVVLGHEPHRPGGILTERDILKVIAMDQLYQPTSPHEISLLDMTVMSFMTTPVISITTTSSIWDALEIMQRNNFRRLPVVKDEKLVGIITERDIAKAIANNRSMVCDVPDRIPSYASSVIERLREITVSDTFFPNR